MPLFNTREYLNLHCFGCVQYFFRENLLFAMWNHGEWLLLDDCSCLCPRGSAFGVSYDPHIILPNLHAVNLLSQGQVTPFWSFQQVWKNSSVKTWNKTQARFVVSCIWGCFFKPPLQVWHTWLCPCISALAEATYEASLRALEGCRVSSNCHSRVQDWDIWWRWKERQRGFFSPMRGY